MRFYHILVLTQVAIKSNIKLTNKKEIQMNTQTLNDKEFAQSETVYEYLLRTYNVKDDLTRCTLWEMVKDGLFDNLMEEKGLLPF